MILINIRSKLDTNGVHADAVETIRLRHEELLDSGLTVLSLDLITHHVVVCVPLRLVNCFILPIIVVAFLKHHNVCDLWIQLNLDFRVQRLLLLAVR